MCPKRTLSCFMKTLSSLYGFVLLGEPGGRLDWLLLPVQSKHLCWYCLCRHVSLCCMRS